MNDRTFGEETARQWICTIENRTNPVREQDLDPLLRTWMESAAPVRVLEIGCGQGDCSARINLAGRYYIGVDPSSFLIHRARELFEAENRRFEAGNAYALPFADRQFDGVFTVMVWHLLSDIQKAAGEMSRVLKPGGHFLIVTANPDSRAEWAELYADAKTDGRRFEGDMRVDGKTLDHDVLYFHTLDEIVESLGLAKLEVGSVEPFRKSNQGQGREYLISIQGTLPRCESSSQIPCNPPSIFL
jgi:SAM-dependent methyltransferase